MSYSSKYVHAMMRRFRPPKRLASRAAKLMKFYAKKTTSSSSSSSNHYLVNTNNANSNEQRWEEITIPETPRTRGFNSNQVFLHRKKELSLCNNQENVLKAMEDNNNINNNKRAFCEEVKQFDNGISNVNDDVKSKNCRNDIQVINVHIPSIPRHVSQEHQKCHLQCTVQTAENQSTTKEPIISDHITPIAVSTQHALRIINETSKEQRVMLQKSNEEKRQLCHAPHSLLESIRVFTPTSSIIEQEQTDVVSHGKWTKSKANIVHATSYADDTSTIYSFTQNKRKNGNTSHSQRIRERENDSRNEHFSIEPTLHKKQLSFTQTHHKHHVHKSTINNTTTDAAATVNVYNNNSIANVKYEFHSHIMAPEQLYDEHEMTCTEPKIYSQKEIEYFWESSNLEEINDSYNSDTCNSVNKRESSVYNCSNDSYSCNNDSTHSDCKILVSEHVEHSEEFRHKNKQLTSETEREKKWIQQAEESESNDGSSNNSNDDDDDALSFEITEMYDPDITLYDAWNEVQASKDDSDWFSTPEKTISWLERAKSPRWKVRRAIMSPRQILYETIMRNYVSAYHLKYFD